jgi:hypothetical protein
MRLMHRIVLLVGLVAIAPVLAGCENFDMDKLDVFGLNEKKKLPGDRKPVFPGGVPGVSQGIPPEYLKGNQPPPESAQTPTTGQDANAPAADPAKQSAAVEPAEEPKAKPRKPKVSKQKLIPDQNPPPAQAQQPAQQQPPQQSSNSPWPAAPASGNVSR